MIQTVSRGAILAIVLACAATVARAQQFADIVMDARTGQVIQQVNADARVHPASLTPKVFIAVKSILRSRC